MLSACFPRRRHMDERKLMVSVQCPIILIEEISAISLCSVDNLFLLIQAYNFMSTTLLTGISGLRHCLEEFD